MAQKLWTRDEEIIVFNLYCKIPFNRSSKNHPEVIRIAKLINRTPSAVNMKIGNFGSLDETLRARGITGLANRSKLDAQIWAEFNNHWDELAFESERLIADLQGKRDKFSTVGDECERTNPANGLCLNALHGKAFNLGFITVTPDYKIHVATNIFDVCDNVTVEKFFRAYDGQQIVLPEKFAPPKIFLEYHNDAVFRR